MRTLFRIHEWLADHVGWINYPKPQVRSLSGHAHGWKARWATRPFIPRPLALFLPSMMLFVPYIGVYLAVLTVVFLFFYFRRN